MNESISSLQCSYWSSVKKMVAKSRAVCFGTHDCCKCLAIRAQAVVCCTVLKRQFKLITVDHAYIDYNIALLGQLSLPYNDVRPIGPSVT